MRLKLTGDGGGRGHGEGWEKLYKRLPDLPAYMQSKERDKGTIDKRTGVGVGAGWL